MGDLVDLDPAHAFPDEERREPATIEGGLNGEREHLDQRGELVERCAADDAQDLHASRVEMRSDAREHRAMGRRHLAHEHAVLDDRVRERRRRRERAAQRAEGLLAVRRAARVARRILHDAREPLRDIDEEQLRSGEPVWLRQERRSRNHALTLPKGSAADTWSLVLPSRERYGVARGIVRRAQVRGVNSSSSKTGTLDGLRPLAVPVGPAPRGGARGRLSRASRRAARRARRASARARSCAASPSSSASRPPCSISACSSRPIWSGCPVIEDGRTELRAAARAARGTAPAS